VPREDKVTTDLSDLMATIDEFVEAENLRFQQFAHSVVRHLATIRSYVIEQDAARQDRMPDFLSVKDIAGRTSLSTRQVLNLLDAQAIPSRRIGTRRVVLARDYVEWRSRLAGELS
jgi:hypothetical protein